MQSKGSISAAVASATYSFDQNQEQALALVALSHTVVEQQLYCAMLAEISSVGTRVASFTIRGLMILTGLGGYSTVRRGLAGLGNKLSIERQKVAGNNGNHQPQTVYLVFTPAEILERRRAVGLPAYPKGVESEHGAHTLVRAIRRVVEVGNLSRREAQAALCCAEGLTKAAIGTRVQASEQTRKGQLRNIFVKFCLKHRPELPSRIFRDGSGTDFVL